MTSTNRLRALDVFRGLTIAIMILVNSPGNNTSYAYLDHSVWNGCTLADVVFPFFIFIVGLSSVFSLTKALDKGHSHVAILLKITKRALLIFLIGLLLNAFPRHFDFETLRVFGVLQRIAVCYFFTATMFLTTTARTQIITTIAILIGYWLCITQLSTPHYTADNNIAASIDRLLFSSAHLYGKTFDPEGLLSTIPSFSTALIGNLTAIWLMRSTRPSLLTAKTLFITGSIMLIIAAAWGLIFPINKTLWSSSYVLWTGGLALQTLAGCFWVTDIKHYHSCTRFFEIFGMNALAAYILHVFFLKIQAMFTYSLSSGETVGLRPYLTDMLFGWASSHNASLLYALSYTLLWFLVLMLMDHKKVYLKL